MVEGESGRVREADIYPRLNAWLDRSGAQEILDIGCGQGICSDQIRLEGRNYTGVEPCPILRARASELYGGTNRRFVAGDAYALPFDDEAFDAAFSISVWHLLADLDEAARELMRVLKPGGHFWIVTANPEAYDLWKPHDPDGEMKRHSRAALLASLPVTKTEVFRGSQYLSLEGRR